MAAILVNGFIMTTLLATGGDLVLHASAVEIDGRAHAFVGRSGHGKSTVSAWLCRAGARLITDDVLRVTRTATGEWLCWPGATENRLRAGAASIAGAQSGVSGDGRLLTRPLHVERGEPLPLGGLYVPHPDRDGDSVRLRSLDPRAALVALLSFPRIVGVRDAEWLRRDLAHQAALAETVPMSVLTLPWGPPFTETVAETAVLRLRAHS
jgi:hypothetical protein